MNQEKDLYFVAVKIFLVNNADELLILRDIYDDGWDIPGGRLLPSDFDADLGRVVERKMREELGDEVRYILEDPIVFLRHEREDANPPEGVEKRKRRIFAVGYSAKYTGGDIRLGEYFKDFKWVPIRSFIPEEYFVGGWLKGVKEFQEKFKKCHGK